MASLWSRLVGGKNEERLGVDAWGQMFAQTFSFNGNSYPIMPAAYGSNNKSESIEADFQGYVQSAYKQDGIVFACMMTIQLVFTEMRFAYQQESKGRPTNLFSSKELDILQKPWPNGTTGELLARAFQDAYLAGNHYIVREFDRKTKTERLRRLRPDWVDILLTAEPQDTVKSDVAGYVYKPGGTQDPDNWVIYPIDGSNGAVAHWSPVPDPEAQYRGMSMLTPIVHEILADKGANLHKQKFFEQGATPQLAVSLNDVTTPDQFKEFMELLDGAHSGVGNAYKTMYLAGGADVTVVGAHLQQLDFRNMQGHVETRIAAALRVHPVLVGLAEALHGTPLNIGNYQAAKDMFGEATMRPLWRSLCAAYQALVHEFPGAHLWFDDRDIAFLRQDRQAQADLQLAQANTANTFVMAGFEPESIKAYLVSGGDVSLLKHTGLTSVQLLPPGQSHGAASASGGTSGGPGQPVPPPPDPKHQGQKDVTPVPKEPKVTKLPASPFTGKQPFQNKDT